MAARIEEIKKQLQGKTGMSPEIEQDLFERIAEIEESPRIVPAMTKVDLAIGIVLVALVGFLPVVLVLSLIHI